MILKYLLLILLLFSCNEEYEIPRNENPNSRDKEITIEDKSKINLNGFKSIQQFDLAYFIIKNAENLSLNKDEINKLGNSYEISCLNLECLIKAKDRK